MQRRKLRKPRNHARTPRRDPRRGATIVESVFVLAFTLFIWMGTFDIGQLMMRQQGLVERVRAGCRYAIVAQFNEAEIRNVVLYNEPDPTNPPAVGLLGLKPEMVSVSRDDVGDEAAERVTVSIHDYPMFMFTPGLKKAMVSRPVLQSITVENLGSPTL